MIKRVYQIGICLLIIFSCSLIVDFYFDRLIVDKNIVVEQNIAVDNKVLDTASEEKCKQQLDWNKAEENDWFVWKPGSSYIRRLPEE